MFVGRERELAALNKLYEEKTFQMTVIYGRRRIGKTSLIAEFKSGKPAILFTAQEVNDTLNLYRFSKTVFQFFGLPESTGAFVNWDDAFDFIAEKAKERRFILAFDEFPNAVNANRALKSILQIAVDQKFLQTGIFLILCGSQMGFMESEVLGYKSPLFGRRTAQIKLEEIDYFDAGKMLSGFNVLDKLKLYACIGGTPHYLAQVKQSESFEVNIKRLFFDLSGYLYNEPMMLLQQELREPAVYNSIITAIAGGASKLNEIATKSGEESAKVNKYLQTLMNLHIIQKICPFGENPQNSRRGIYRIAENCYAFWYVFVFLNKPEIESGNGNIIADTDVFGEKLDTFIGKPSFETICLQYLQRANRKGKLPFTATSFGCWWGNDPASKAQTDIDAIAANRTGKQILLGECKWKSGLNLISEANKLMNKNHLLVEYNTWHYYIFTKKTVKNDFRQQAGYENVRFVSADMLFDI